MDYIRHRYKYQNISEEDWGRVVESIRERQDMILEDLYMEYVDYIEGLEFITDMKLKRQYCADEVNRFNEFSFIITYILQNELDIALQIFNELLPEDRKRFIYFACSYQVSIE